MTKSVCFDVLGTCFGFEAAIEAIEARLGDRLRAIGVDPKTLFFSWFYAAQRDFTYTTVIGQYTPIAQVLKSTFRRYVVAANDFRNQSDCPDLKSWCMQSLSDCRSPCRTGAD